MQKKKKTGSRIHLDQCYPTQRSVNVPGVAAVGRTRLRVSRARETGDVSRRGTVTRFGWRGRGGRAGQGGCAGSVRGPRPCVRVRATTSQRHVPRTQPPRFWPQRTLHAAFGGGNEPELPSGRALLSASAARAPWARAGLWHILDVCPVWGRLGTGSAVRSPLRDASEPASGQLIALGSLRDA